MKSAAPPLQTTEASTRPRTDTARAGRRRTPPAAFQVLLPVWGYEFVRQFLDIGLPTLLAPGNLPALARMRPCEFVVLTSDEDEAFIRSHPTFHALSAVCATEIRSIDHLITGTNYSTTLTLAYTEAVRATGSAMVDTCFFFLVSDYIVADGSLAHVAERIVAGASGVLAGNFQVAADSGLPWLRARLNRATPALSLSARELMRWGLAHLHPAVAANTVNFPLTHNRHTNRLFWRVDSQTLVGRFYLMHPIAVRPEVTDFVIGAACDYSFIPEMCPSGNVQIMTDSDDYLVVELQPRDHEARLLRAGPLRPRALARTLSEWTTDRHRQNARHSVIFHAGDPPGTMAQAIADADHFIAEVGRSLRREPQAYRGHPYWIGALAAYGDATGAHLDPREQWLALGLPDRLMTRFQHPFGRWLVETAASVVFGRPPFVRPWHPRWVDYALVIQELRGFIRDRRQRLLMIADRATPFTVALADNGERVVRQRTTRFLENRQEAYGPLAQTFDLCLLELSEGELKRSDQVVDRVVPLMKPGGRILVVVYNARTRNPAEFASSVGFHAGRLMRAGTILGEVRVAPATRVRWYVSRAITGLGLTAYHRPWVGVPLAGLCGGFLGLANLLAGSADRGRHVGGLRQGMLATSVHVVLNVDAVGRDAYRHAAGGILERRLDRRPRPDGDLARALALGPPPDTALMLGDGADAGIARGLPGETHDPGDARFPTALPRSPGPPSGKDATREPQYGRCVDLRDRIGLTPLGLMSNQVWHDDPRRLGILLARYKFVAKMLSGRHDVGEIGCGDAFGARVVLQEVDAVTVYDFDPVFIEDIRRRFSERWPLTAQVHDIVAGPLPRRHDGLYSLDVIEHIPHQDEDAYLANLSASLTADGVLVVGSPSRESQTYASPPSRAGHVNCKTGEEMKALLRQYFTHVFLFSMNDEVVHTGFYPMAHYLLAVCCGKK